MQITTKVYRVFCVLLPVLSVSGTPLLSQTSKTHSEFLINVNRPFVYVKFDHIGTGAPRSENEPSSHIWLRLTNNCRIPILVLANGVPDESPKDEVGVQYDVVRDHEIQGAIVSFSQSSVAEISESEKGKDQQESKAAAEEVPRGYMFDVASLVSIEPGRDILFSLPVNHLSKKWHIEIPFEFELPKGKGPRDPINGGIPVQYSLLDLPPKSREEVGK
jgi:hypothetical protein